MMKKARGKSHRGFIKPGFRPVSELHRHGIPHASGPRNNVHPPKDDEVVDYSAKPGSRGSLSTRNGNPEVGLSSSLEYMNVTPEADAGTFGSIPNCNSSSVAEDRDRNADDQSLASALWDQLVIDSEVKQSFQQPFSSPGGFLVEANPNVGEYQQHWLHPGASSGCHLNPLDECVPLAPQVQISDVPVCPVYQVVPFPVVAFQHPFYIGFPPYDHGVELNPAYYGQFGGDEYQGNYVVAAQMAYNHYYISKEVAETVEGQLLDSSSSDGCEMTEPQTKPTTSSVGKANERQGKLDHESNPQHGSYNPPSPLYTKQTCDKGLRAREERLGRPHVSTSPMSSSDRTITSPTPKKDAPCPRNPPLSKEKLPGGKKSWRFFDSGPVRGKFRPFGPRNIVHRSTSAPVNAPSINNPRFF